MSKITKSRRRVGTLAIGLAIFLGASVAFAAWTTNSEPWAAGSTATADHPVVSNAHVVGALYPGYCNDVELTVTNNNPVAVTVTGLGNQGFRNPKNSAGATDNRLLDFLTQADKGNALNGEVINAGATRTFNVPNAVCLSSQTDDARQTATFEAGYAVAYVLATGSEAPN